MDTALVLELIAIFILILANGFFALSEFSIIASRKSRLQQKIEKGKRGAKAAENLRSSPDRFLASVQVGITLLAILAGVFGGATLVIRLSELLKLLQIEVITDFAHPISVALVAILITIFSVVLGELVPKYLALSNPEFYARQVAPTIFIFTKMSAFASGSLSKLSHLILKLFGVKMDRDDGVISEDEINHLIYEGKQKGVFDEIEERLIKSVFDFADSTVRRALTPRTDMVAINNSAQPDEIVDTIIEHGYSRYPIFETTVDNIIGILYAKDIIVHKMDPNLIIIKDLLREPLFVPDSMPLSNLLNVFQKQKRHIAVVLDEFGGTAGIITLEDILEELVGEIQDEYDAEQEPLVKHSETVAFADGVVWPGEVNDLMKSHLPEDKAETLAGLVIDEFGTIPRKKDSIQIADMKITILEQQENRLSRLKLEKIEADDNVSQPKED